MVIPRRQQKTTSSSLWRRCRQGRLSVMAPRRGALGIIAWIGLFFCVSVIMVQAVIILAQWFAYQDYFNTTGGLQEKFYMKSKHGGTRSP
jgi:hypothetical protein